jgi:hypothetical protein
MASTTIHTLSYKMVADTQQFTRGLVASKSEVSMLKKVLGDTTPEQKTQKALASLQRLYEHGKISQLQYRDATAKVRAELTALKGSAAGTSVTMSKLGGQFRNLVTGYIGIGAVEKIFRAMGASLANLDDQQDNAERFGLVVDDFIRLQFALQKGGDLDKTSATGAIKSMRDNIQLAAMDMGRFKELFAELGADQDIIAAIAFQPVNKQLETMVTLIGQIPDAGKRGLITSKLFGTDEGQMASLINGGVKGLEEMYDQAEKFRLLQGTDAGAIDKVAERWKEVGFVWQGVVKELTVAMLPIAEALAETLRRFFPDRPTVKSDIKPMSDAEFMASQVQRGMVSFKNNKGKYTTTVTGNLEQSKLEDFFSQARQLDPNFGRSTLTPNQSQRLFRSALPGDPGGNQQQVQLQILEELRRQTAASEEMLRQRQEQQFTDIPGLIN